MLSKTPHRRTSLVVALSLLIFGGLAAPAVADESGNGAMEVTINRYDSVVSNTAVSEFASDEQIPLDSMELTTVYVDGMSGDDANDGATPETAVQTTDRAYALVEAGGTIHVQNETSLGGNSLDSVVLPAKPVTFTGSEDGKLVLWSSRHLLASTTFENITIHNISSGRMLTANGYPLTFGDGVEITEQDTGPGTGLIVIAGGYYNNTNDNISEPDETDFAAGSNLVINSGTFGAVVAGPATDFGNYNTPLYLTATYNVTVGGTAKVRDIYAGAYLDGAAVSVDLLESHVTVNSPEATVGNIFGGAYLVTATAPVTQQRTIIDVMDGQVDVVFGGSLTALNFGGVSRVEETTLNFTGGNIGVDDADADDDEDTGIVAGDITLGTGDFAPEYGFDSEGSLGKMLINVSKPLDAPVLAGGVRQRGTGDSDFGPVTDAERVDTEAIEVALVGGGSIGDVELVEEEGVPTTANASARTVVFGAESNAVIPNGFLTLGLRDGGRAQLDRNLAFDSLTTDGNAENSLQYVESATGWPVLTVKDTATVGSPITLDFQALTTSDYAALINRPVVTFTDASALNAGDFTLATGLPFALVARGNSLYITGQEATPEIEIDFFKENLTGFLSNDSYTINGVAVTPSAELAVPIDTSWLGTELSIIKLAKANTTDSNAQALTIPARPSAPAGLVGTSESKAGAADGSISGELEGCEYRLESGQTWTACQNGQVVGLAAGKYQVRFAATSTSFASLHSLVEVSLASTSKTPGTDTSKTDTVAQAQKHKAQMPVTGMVGLGLLAALTGAAGCVGTVMHRKSRIV